jgi:hypothetical protein
MVIQPLHGEYECENNPSGIFYRVLWFYGAAG